MRTLAAAITCLLTLLSATANAGEGWLDFVLDLDGLMFYRATEAQRGEPGVIKAGGEYWRIADGAAELVESLLRIPRARLSFFSAYSHDRNVEALRQIRLTDGRNAVEAAEGRILSGEDVTVDENGLSKDLRKVISGIELLRAVLIDDVDAMSHPGQERNLLWAREEGGSGANRATFRRNKLARVRGLVELMLERAAERGVPPVEALHEIQWKKGEYDVTLDNNLSLYRKGARLLRAVNPAYRFTPAFSKPLEAKQCPEAMETLLTREL